MDPRFKVALGVATALAVSMVGCTAPAASPGVGNGSQTPSTSLSTPSQGTAATTRPTRTPGPWVLPDGPLVEHEYFAQPLSPPNDGMTFTFSVPAGWVGFQGGGLFPETGTEAPTGMGFGIGQIERLHSDPCRGVVDGVKLPGDVTIGPRVEDLVDAFAQRTAYETSVTPDIELAGYPGQRVDLQLPLEFDCAMESFRPWEGSIHPQGPGDRWRIWILDVEGVTVIVVTRDFAATPPDDQAELQGIVDSLRITP